MKKRSSPMNLTGSRRGDSLVWYPRSVPVALCGDWWNTSDVPERGIRSARDGGEAEEEKKESNAITETGDGLNYWRGHNQQAYSLTVSIRRIHSVPYQSLTRHKDEAWWDETQPAKQPSWYWHANTELTIQSALQYGLHGGNDKKKTCRE